MTGVAIGCALLAAVCGAFGALLQHRGVRAVTGGDALRLRRISSLLRTRSWLLGVGVLGLCAVCQILALTLAPVTVVAPIVVLALPMVAVLNARAIRVRLGGVARVAVVLSTLAVGLFVGITAGTAEETGVAADAVWAAARVVAVVVAACGVLALSTSGIVRCIALATGAGVAYGLLSVLVRDVGYAVRVEGLTGTPLGSLAAMVLTFLIGSWLVQLAYASGPPDVVVGFQTVLNPLVATAIGMTALGEITDIAGGTLAVLLGCAVLAVAGVAVLARHHPDAARLTPPDAHPRGMARDEPR